MKIISVEIACKDDDVYYINQELAELQLGIYSFGTIVRQATDSEEHEIKTMVPQDILDNYLKQADNGIM